MNSVLWATVIDLLFGEPPTSVHPTVQMGNYIKRYKRLPNPTDRTDASRMFLRGAAITAGGMALSALFGAGINAVSNGLPVRYQRIARGVLLKPTLSLRALLSAARSIELALAKKQIEEARRLLSWHLVSRDTSQLTATEVAGAAIESIAENLSDSFIAPILAYRIGGLRAAYAYRFVNTADAMLGYRTPDLEWLGKFAARTDDMLNFAPARLTAMCISLSAPVSGGSIRESLKVLRRNAHRTTSPNAGWPMAAMAGALGCRLTKRGVYVLNDNGKAPTFHDLRRARKIVSAAGMLGVGLLGQRR